MLFEVILGPMTRRTLPGSQDSGFRRGIELALSSARSSRLASAKLKQSSADLCARFLAGGHGVGLFEMANRQVLASLLGQHAGDQTGDEGGQPS